MKSDVAGLFGPYWPKYQQAKFILFSISLLCIALLFFYPGNGNGARLPLQDHIIDIPGTEGSRYSLVLIKCGSFAVTAQDQPGDSHICSTARNKPSDLVFVKNPEHRCDAVGDSCKAGGSSPPRLLDIPAGIVGSRQCRGFGCSPQSGCLFALTLLCVGVWEVDLSVPCLLKALLGWRGVVLWETTAPELLWETGKAVKVQLHGRMFWKAAWGENSHILWQQNQ